MPHLAQIGQSRIHGSWPRETEASFGVEADGTGNLPDGAADVDVGSRGRNEQRGIVPAPGAVRHPLGAVWSKQVAGGEDQQKCPSQGGEALDAHAL